MYNKIKKISFFLCSSLFLVALVIQFQKKLTSFPQCNTQLKVIYDQNEELDVIFHAYLFSNSEGLLTYRGYIKKNNLNYAVNLDVPFIISDRSPKIITLKEPIKKFNDSTPENSFFYKMVYGGYNYYLTLYKTPSGDIIFNGRGGIAFVCSHQ